MYMIIAVKEGKKEMRKRILCLFPRFGIGGISKALCFVANTLYDAGHEVVCTAMSLEEETINLNKRIPRHHIKYDPTGSIYRVLLTKAQALLKLRANIIKVDPDIIVTFGSDHARIALLASVGLKCKVIGSERGDPGQYTAAQMRKYTKAYKHGRCAAIVFQTERAQSAFDEEIRQRSVVIPNAAAPRHDLVAIHTGEREKSIVSCGRLSEEKNFVGLIRAFSKVTDQFPGYQLKIYGDGPQKEELENLVSTLNLQGKVVFPGNQPDVFALECACGMFVLNSLTEGMPNALIEAMIAGIPCIATDCPSGGVSFLADGGRRVRLVSVKDDDALAESITQVAGDKHLADELVQNAREICEILAPEVISSKWQNLIEAI